MPQANDGTNDASTTEQEAESTPRLIADGGNKKVIGKFNNSSGIGVYGYVTAGTGTTCGVKGEVDSSDGYGLATPNDAKIKGTVDTAETDFVLEAGTNNTGGATNIVAGFSENKVKDGATGAVIAGGGEAGQEPDLTRANVVTDNYCVIGGGTYHTAGNDSDDDPSKAEFATIGGGRRHEATATHTTVSGGNFNKATASKATVGGGESNEASGENATVAGGYLNDATGKNATVAGGNGNDATSSGATVAGGTGNTASGTASFAAGAYAKAEDDNSFVWNDGSGETDADGAGDDQFSSSTSAGSSPTGSNTFHAKSTGGVRFVTSADNSNTTYISSTSAGWTTTSTRAAKTNVDPVDTREALAGVEEMEISTWEYKDEDGDGQGERHIGPMAEEFHEAFDVGDSDEHINSINADGVMFAAIQGLSERVDDARAEIAGRDERINELEDENTRLREQLDAKAERIDELEERLAAIETQVGATTSPADD